MYHHRGTENTEGGSFFIRSGDDDQIKDQSAEGRWDMLLGLAQKKTSLCTSDKK